jgi:hypothetical protein
VFCYLFLFFKLFSHLMECLKDFKSLVKRGFIACEIKVNLLRKEYKF